MSKTRLVSKNSDKNYNSEKASLPLLFIPKEIRREELYPISPLKVLGLLAQTSKLFEGETADLRLLSAAIHAAPKFMDVKENPKALSAIAILEKYPNLLFIQKEVTDHYGRKIFASPYQIFLGAGDVWALRQVYERVIPKIQNGAKQAEEQFLMQFPNFYKKLENDMDEETMFYDARNIKQIEAIVKQLGIVKKLLEVDPFNNNKLNDMTKKAVEKLCKLFKPTPGEVIKSGLHFPLAILEEIYKTYGALLENCEAFFTLAVIKPALDALSTVDAQIYQSGLWMLLDEKHLEEVVTKGPDRRCHSSYKHPLGKPLALTLVNDKSQPLAVFVEPFHGEVFFVSPKPSFLHGFFHCYNTIGKMIGDRLQVTASNATLSLLKEYKKIKQEHLQVTRLLCPVNDNPKGWVIR